MQSFRSKIDWWLLGFIIAITGLLIQFLFTMYAKGTMTEYFEHTAIYLFTILMLWWPIFNTRYIIQNETLRIRCMFIKWEIPLSCVQKISKSSNSISSPALSLDRLKIEYVQDGKMKNVLVSPKDQSAFIQAVQRK